MGYYCKQVNIHVLLTCAVISRHLCFLFMIIFIVTYRPPSDRHATLKFCTQKMKLIDNLYVYMSQPWKLFHAINNGYNNKMRHLYNSFIECYFQMLLLAVIFSCYFWQTSFWQLDLKSANLTMFTSIWNYSVQLF